MAAFVADFGLVDGAGLEHLVCMKDRPHTPGNPAYFFGGVDDQSSKR